MAGALRAAVLLTGTLVLQVAAQPYNLRTVAYMDAACSSPIFLQEYYFPKLNQCVNTPNYPPAEANFPTSNMAIKVEYCTADSAGVATSAVVSACNTACGNCVQQTVAPMTCIQMPNGFSQMMNFTCTMDMNTPAASTGRPVEPCFEKSMVVAQACKYTDGIDVCDTASPCYQSLQALWPVCQAQGNRPMLWMGKSLTVSVVKTQTDANCQPCSLASAKVVLTPYCSSSGVCYSDCVQNINTALASCVNQGPVWASSDQEAADLKTMFQAGSAKCGTNTVAPPTPSSTATITLAYFQASSEVCAPVAAWPNIADITVTYSIGPGVCTPGPLSPTNAAGSYQLRFDACNAKRVVVAMCDMSCVCSAPMEMALGGCINVGTYRQKLTWDRCPVPMRPTTTTMAPATTTMAATSTPMPGGATTVAPSGGTTTMAPSGGTTTMAPDGTTMAPATTTLPPPAPTVAGSMTVKAASAQDAAALVADPQVKTAFANGIASLAGVDPSLVSVTLSVPTRRLSAAEPRRLQVSILVSYVITLAATAGTGGIGGAPLPTPDTVKTLLTNATPTTVQASVTAAYAAMKVTPPAFTVDTVAAPTVIPTTTTTVAGRIGQASGAEWGARAWLAGLLAVAASARLAL